MTTETRTVEFDPRALDVLTAMRDRVNQVHATWGEAEAHRLGHSLGTNLATLIGYGGKIFADGELGLVSHSFITVGMVFHREDQIRTANKVYGERDFSEKDQAYFRQFVQSGEWSLHS